MDFLKLAKKRYACRKYLSRQVEPEKLELILEAGRVAPTGANRQPQRLVVVQSKEGMERLARCTRDFGAPTAVIVCADTSEAWQKARAKPLILQKLNISYLAILQKRNLLSYTALQKPHYCR